MTTTHVRLENPLAILQVSKSPQLAASSSGSSSPAVSIGSPAPTGLPSAPAAVMVGDSTAQQVPAGTKGALEPVTSPGTSSTPRNGTLLSIPATANSAALSPSQAMEPPTPPTAGVARRPSFGLNFLNSLTNSIRSHSSSTQLQVHNSGNNAPNVLPAAVVTSLTSIAAHNGGAVASTVSETSPAPFAPPAVVNDSKNFMSNSPTIANFNNYNITSIANGVEPAHEDESPSEEHPTNQFDTTVTADDEPTANSYSSAKQDDADPAQSGQDKDGFFSVRLTPLIDHSSSNSGLYFAPVIRKAKADSLITIGRYTEKNKAAAHAPQGSSAPIVFKSKVVSRTHALFQCNEDGQWFIKDSKSSSGTFLNHVRLSPASQESSLMPLIDGDIVQLGMDYRGGTEEVYRCVKMRCEFNKSWQRKVNQFNLEIHQKLKNLAIQNPGSVQEAMSNPINNALKDELSECAICLLKLEPCQALFISPCSHSWHYKCIRPIIIKSYPQFYCPNCRSMCDLETDIEDDD